MRYKMIDRSLNLLFLHIIWKTRNLMHNTGAAEEVQFRETLREQRDTLGEKLVEYSIGTQSNSLLSVKRAVSPVRFLDISVTHAFRDL